MKGTLQVEFEHELLKFNEELKQFKIINHKSSADSKDFYTDPAVDPINEEQSRHDC